MRCAMLTLVVTSESRCAPPYLMRRTTGSAACACNARRALRERRAQAGSFDLRARSVPAAAADKQAEPRSNSTMRCCAPVRRAGFRYISTGRCVFTLDGVHSYVP